MLTEDPPQSGLADRLDAAHLQRRIVAQHQTISDLIDPAASADPHTGLEYSVHQKVLTLAATAADLAADAFVFAGAEGYREVEDLVRLTAGVMRLKDPEVASRATLALLGIQATGTRLGIIPETWLTSDTVRICLEASRDAVG